MFRNRKHILVAASTVVVLSAALGIVLTVTLKGKEGKEVKPADKKDDGERQVADAAKGADAAGLLTKGQLDREHRSTAGDVIPIDKEVSLRDALMDGVITHVKSDLLTALDHAVAFFGGVSTEAVGGVPGAQTSKLFGVDAQRASNLMSKHLDDLKKIRVAFYNLEAPKLDVEEVDILKPEELEEGLKELPTEVVVILNAAYSFKLSYKQLQSSFRGALASTDTSSKGTLGSFSDGLAESCAKVTAGLNEILDIVVRNWNAHDPQFGENFKQVLDWLLLFRTEDGFIKLRMWIVLFGDWLTGYVQANKYDPLVEHFRTHVLTWTARSIISKHHQRGTSNKSEPIPESRTEVLHTQRIENFVIGMFTDFSKLLSFVGILLGVDALTSEVKLERCVHLIPTAVDIMGEFLDQFVKPPEDGPTQSEDDILQKLIIFVFEQYGMTIYASEYEAKMPQARQLRKHMQVLSQNLNFLRPFFLQYRKELFA